MKKVFLIAGVIFCMSNIYAQTIKEFDVKPQHQEIILDECGYDEGVIVIYSPMELIFDLENADNNRIINQKREGNRTVLCIKPNDASVRKYQLEIKTRGYMPKTIALEPIKAKEIQCYKIDEKYDGYNNKKFHFGVVAGLSLANQSSDSWIFEDGINARIGFHAGLLFEYKFNPYFSFQPELLFVQKGATGKSYTSEEYIYTNTDEYIPDVLVDAKIELNYLELPLNFIINVPTGRNSAIFFGGGYTFAYGLSGKMTLEPSKEDITFYLSKEEKESDIFDGDESLFSRFDGSVNLLAGFRFNRFFVRAGYEWGNNIATNTDDGYYYFKNTCFNLSVGVKF